MFTGIVEEQAEVLEAGSGRLRVASRVVAAGLDVGASVAVDGVCLTLVARTDGTCSFDLSQETFARTTLGGLRPGSRVNLERPVTLASRLGGHLVQGHVDGVGTVGSVSGGKQGDTTVRILVPDHLLRFIIEKGSVAVDGVSLTVAAIHADGIDLALIPHTLAVTTLGSLTPGDGVNVEVDMIAKYVQRQLEHAEQPTEGDRP